MEINTTDEYLLLATAAPGTINPKMGRSDDRALEMLALRDAGEHPSAFSDSSRLQEAASRAGMTLSPASATARLSPIQESVPTATFRNQSSSSSTFPSSRRTAPPRVEEVHGNDDDDDDDDDDDYAKKKKKKPASSQSALFRYPKSKDDDDDYSRDRDRDSKYRKKLSSPLSSLSSSSSSDKSKSKSKSKSSKSKLSLSSSSRHIRDDDHDHDDHDDDDDKYHYKSTGSKSAGSKSAGSKSAGSKSGHRNKYGDDDDDDDDDDDLDLDLDIRSSGSKSDEGSRSNTGGQSFGGRSVTAEKAAVTAATAATSTSTSQLQPRYPPMVGTFQPETPFQRKYREMLQAAATQSGIGIAQQKPQQQPLNLGLDRDRDRDEDDRRQRHKFPSTASSAVESSVSHPGASEHRRRRHDSRNRRDRDRDRKDRDHRRHRKRSSSSSSSRSRRSKSSTSSRNSAWEEMQRENKMELLIELTKLQSCGVVLSFEPSMDVPLWKLKHEYQQHEAQQTLIARVSVVKKGIKMTTLILSTFAGKFLKLEGWSDYVHGELDTGNYDSALEQIYRTVAGRGRPNCWVQIVLLVVGTAIAYHIHNLQHEKGLTGNGENIVFKIFSVASKAMAMLKPQAPRQQQQRNTTHAVDSERVTDRDRERDRHEASSSSRLTAVSSTHDDDGSRHTGPAQASDNATTPMRHIPRRAR